MAKNKPKRTKDQLIIDPILDLMCNKIETLNKENKRLKAEIAEMCALKKADIGKINTKGSISESLKR